MSNEKKTVSVWEDFFHYSANRCKVIPDGTTVGVANATAYKSALVNILHKGYHYINESMKILAKNGGTVSDEVKNDYFAAIRALVALIGEVNGDTLNTKALADLLLAKTFKLDSAPMCLTDESAHCWSMLKEARKVVNKSDDPTPEQLAEFTQIPLATIYQKLEHGDIPASKPGKRWVIFLDDVAVFIFVFFEHYFNLR